MASVRPDPRKNGSWQVRFCYGGTQLTRSLGAVSAAQAGAAKVRIEETLALLASGRLAVPEGADAPLWIVTDGRVRERPKAPPPARGRGTAPAGTIPGGPPATLGELIDGFVAGRTPGAKEDGTLAMEKIHQGHLRRLIGERTPLADLGPRAAQDYVNARARAGVIRKTIEMELKTLRMMVNRAVRLRGAEAPPAWTLGGLDLPKAPPKEPFQTWEQVEARIARGRLDRAKAAELWDAVYLDERRIARLMVHVRETSRQPYRVPMFALCAYTGMRRGEMMRAEVDDIDFAGKTVAIRQKKADRTRTFTFRHFPLRPELEADLRAWLPHHPGGRYLICRRPDTRLNPRKVSDYFRDALAGSEWHVLHGYHVFRHSIASILATRGVDQRVINDLLGHGTEAMEKRYRHLFPDVKARAVAGLFGGPEGPPRA